MSASQNHASNQSSKSIRDTFVLISKSTSKAVGSAWAFATAILAILIWVACGPLFNYSDTWQLVINTSTTIVTFLMVFLIQSTQNRDSKAVHLKLDELIRAMAGARNDMLDSEELTEDELEKLAGEFKALHDKACATLETKSGKKSRSRRESA